MASFRGILNIQSLNEPHFAGNPNPAPDADPHFEQPPQLEPSGGGTTSWLDLTVIQSDTEAQPRRSGPVSQSYASLRVDVRRVICVLSNTIFAGRSGASPPRGRTIRSEAQRSHTGPIHALRYNGFDVRSFNRVNGQWSMLSNALYGPPVRYDVTR